VKETRFCLTLPAWLKYGANIDRVLICLREPIQVAKSIQKRNHSTIGHALNLWHLHNTRLLENAADLPKWYIYYNNVLDEKFFLREARAAFRFFGLAIDDDRIQDLRRKCVKPSMNHYPGEIFPYPPEVEELWKELRKLHEAQFDSH
jgi:hypothetical protein